MNTTNKESTMTISIDYIEHTISRRLEASVTARTEIAQAITTGHTRNFWNQRDNFVKIAVAEFAVQFERSRSMGQPIEEAVTEMRDNLVSGLYDESSTSTFSNAMSDVQRIAAREWLRLLESFEAWASSEESVR